MARTADPPAAAGVIVRPMTTVPRVFASGDLVAKAGDTDVYLLTVESWGEHVTVRLVGASTDATRAEIAAREAEFEAWTHRDRAGSDEWPPSFPGARIAESLQVRVDDEVGTQYCLRVKTGGGSGTELLSQWTFDPGLPSHARTVTVTVTGTDGGTRATTFTTPGPNPRPCP
jgi:hypothetical protein